MASGKLAPLPAEFVIADGCLGALMHGSAMMTRDVDVACRMDSANLLRVFAAF